MTRVLAVRLDSDGDVLLTGPAVRRLHRACGPVDLLVSPAGAAAARLLPDVRDVLVFDAPWSGFAPPPVAAPSLLELVDRLRSRGYDEAVVFTSYHQSPLPMALLARLAGIARVVASSEDYAGSLLDVRHRRLPAGAPDDGGPDGGHEVLAGLALVAAAGHGGGDFGPGAKDTRLAVRRPLPDVAALVPAAPYVVVHPGASVPSRALDPGHARAIVARLLDDGWPVVVTGSPGERLLTGAAAAGAASDLGSRTDLATLAGVLDRAVCVVVGNTGPAHLAAAVGTPVVSLFSPVVPAARWAPWGVPHVLLGDQQAPCRGSRARQCPVAGHPCLTSVTPDAVASAVASLAGPARQVAS